MAAKHPSRASLARDVDVHFSRVSTSLDRAAFHTGKARIVAIQRAESQLYELFEAQKALIRSYQRALRRRPKAVVVTTKSSLIQTHPRHHRAIDFDL